MVTSRVPCFYCRTPLACSLALCQTCHRLQPGQPVAGGQYLVKEKLGEGGEAITYLAEEPGLQDRPVVLRQLKLSGVDPALHQELKADFERQVSVLLQVNHPRVPRALRKFEEEGELVLTQEYCPGETLAAKLRHGALPLQEALQYARQVCEALEALQEAGFVHRDVSPENVVIGPSGASLIDFGIARPTGSATVGIGKESFMAPEQKLGGSVDSRSDVYALAKTLYALLTGQRPPYGPLDFKGSSMEPSLVALLRRATSDGPAMRPWPNEFAVELDKFLENLKGSTPDVPVLPTQRLPVGAALPPASLLARALAFAVDGFTCLVILLLLLMAVGIERWMNALGLQLVLVGLYFVAGWTAWGASLGQRILGLRVLDSNGRKPSLWSASLRLTGYVFCLTSLGVGFVWAAFDARHQGWHDHIAGTFVVHR